MAYRDAVAAARSEAAGPRQPGSGLRTCSLLEKVSFSAGVVPSRVTTKKDIHGPAGADGRGRSPA
jgi:hypothetical protein